MQHGSCRDLHSFPTRRSSDLQVIAANPAGGVGHDLGFAFVLDNQRGGPGRALLAGVFRSEEHTSELQSLRHLVCSLLLEKKKLTHAEAAPAHLVDQLASTIPR